MDHDALETYLNDHLAGSTLGLDHAKQLAERVPVVVRLAHEIEEDRDALIDLMQRVGASENPVKKATAWVSEKAGRLKFSDDELGTYLAIETLSLGVEGKKCLWQALKAVADSHPELAATDLDTLITRASAQRMTLESERVAAAGRAFAA